MIVPPLSAVRHLAGSSLRTEERAFEIGRHDAVPKRLVHIERGADFFIACIVD